MHELTFNKKKHAYILKSLKKSPLSEGVFTRELGIENL
jgi:hypothetical protein